MKFGDEKFAASVDDLQGRILIGGHTDDVPIATENYRSNWELSASRAVTVAHYFLQEPSIEPKSRDMPIIPSL
ncbi:MAG: OmpA family protein [Gammaproteobacteria bacterium]